MAAKRNRKGQFVKGARRSQRKRARRRPSSTLSRYRAAVASLFRRKAKRRRATNPRAYASPRHAAKARFVRKQRALSQAAARRYRARGKALALDEAHARRHRVAKFRGLIGAPAVNPPKKRKSTMAHALARNSKGRFLKRGSRRRRRSVVRVANPRRRRRRHIRSASPRRRHHSRARRAHNPMGGGLIRTAKASIMPMALGGLAGAAGGYVDAKWLKDSATLSILFKIAAAVAGAAIIGKRHPLAAAGWSGGLIGATGYYAGVKMGGGLVALSKKGALAGLADMAADDPDLAAQIAGLSDVVDELSDDASLGDAADDYNAALSDADDMADVVDE